MTTKEIDSLKSLLERVKGCGDNSCIVQEPKGMATNGGCRCSNNRNTVRQALNVLGKLPMLLEEIESLETALEDKRNEVIHLKDRLSDLVYEAEYRD